MKTTTLFQNDQSQVVSLPNEFRLEKDEVLLPIEDPWQPLFDSLNKFSSDFMDDREQPISSSYSKHSPSPPIAKP